MHGAVKFGHTQCGMQILPSLHGWCLRHQRVTAIVRLARGQLVSRSSGCNAEGLRVAELAGVRVLPKPIHNDRPLRDAPFVVALFETVDVTTGDDQVAAAAVLVLDEV